MGRPLPRKFFGDFNDVGTQLAPTSAWIPGEAAANTNTILLSQTGTRAYVARNLTTNNEGIVRLTDNNPVTEGFARLVCYPRIESTGTGFALGTTVSFEVAGFEILNGGQNYAVNDTITVNVGTASPHASFTVTEVSSSGAVVSMSVANRGDYSVLPTAAQIDSSTPSGGAGTGLTIKLNFGVRSVNIGTAGSGYVNGTNRLVVVCRQQNGSGFGTIFLGDVTGGAVTALTLFARGRNYRPTFTGLELLQVYQVEASPVAVKTVSKSRVKTWDGRTLVWDRFGLANFANSCLLRVI